MEKTPLWVCPRCGRKFIKHNMLHSCGSWTVDDFLKGKGPKARALYNRFVEMAGYCGPFTIAPLRTRVTLMVRIRFAAVQRLSEKGMTVSFWLKRKIESPRIQRVDTNKPYNWLHTLNIKTMEELDAEIQKWLCESYRFGEQEKRE